MIITIEFEVEEDDMEVFHFEGIAFNEEDIAEWTANTLYDELSNMREGYRMYQRHQEGFVIRTKESKDEYNEQI